MNSDFKPASFNIDIVKGNTWQEVFALTLNDVPINLSTATVLVSVYKGCSTSAALFTATNGNGITILGVSNNNISISKIVPLDKGNYIWDLKITYLDGTIKTYLWGDFIVYENINQAQ
jgi:hypothetical protein